jgi:hypothetical protein
MNSPIMRLGAIRNDKRIIRYDSSIFVGSMGGAGGLQNKKRNKIKTRVAQEATILTAPARRVEALPLAHRRALSRGDPEGGASAVPARGFANRVRAVRKLARPATTPVCQELAARGADHLSATMKRGTGLSQGREAFG